MGLDITKLQEAYNSGESNEDVIKTMENIVMRQIVTPFISNITEDNIQKALEELIYDCRKQHISVNKIQLMVTFAIIQSGFFVYRCFISSIEDESVKIDIPVQINVTSLGELGTYYNKEKEIINIIITKIDENIQKILKEINIPFSSYCYDISDVSQQIMYSINLKKLLNV